MAPPPSAPRAGVARARAPWPPSDPPRSRSSSRGAVSSTPAPPALARSASRPASRSEKPGRQRLTAVGPPAVGRRDRVDGHDRRQRAGRRGRRHHRDRHPLQRFHEGLADRVQQPDVGSSTSTSRPSTRSSRAASASSPMPGGARCSADHGRLPVSDEYRTRTAELAKEWDDTVSTAYRVEDDGSALNQNQVIGLANTLSTPATWWCAPPARCPAICTSCGEPGTARATTSSTATRAWVTRSPAASVCGWPPRPRRVRHGRRRLVSDDGHRTGDRVQEGIKVILVLVQNHGFASIGSLSESLGSQRFGTAYRYRTTTAGSTAPNCRSTWRPTRPAWVPMSSR